jgi:hypothetical protein
MSIQADIALDPLTGDLVWPTKLLTGLDLIQQRIRTRLRRGLGEWFLDPNGVGLPLLDWRQQKPPRVQEIVSRVQSEIRAIPGVTATANFVGTHDAAARRLTISGDVFAADGAVTALVVTGTTDPARNSMIFGLFFSRNVQGGIPSPSIGRP